MGGRTGATCIPELISTYYGFDFYEQMIKSALGEETDFQQTESCPCMAKLLLSPVSGTITQIDRDQVECLRQEGLELVLDYPEDTGSKTDLEPEVRTEAEKCRLIIKEI